MQKDLLVIGGGINGVGTAADAAGRGLSVLLCEMGDLASGTSSASSNLIHGGLRYLEQGQIALVRESLRERNILMHNAAHLITPQEFAIPYAPTMRPYWLLRSGLFAYDILAFDSNLPRSSAIGVEDLDLQTQYTRALSYYDCTVDDSRLVLHVALQAKQHGAEILTRTKLIKAIRKNNDWIVTLQQLKNTIEVTVKAIVNAAGPYVQHIANNILHTTTEHKVRLVKGSHIVLPRLFKHNKALLLQNPDNRVVFVIPYLDQFTLIGTTEVVVDSPINPTISDAEIIYLCESVNKFLAKSISPKDVVHKYSGIRPLYDDKKPSHSKNSREFVLDVDAKQAPLLTLFGGKLTTYRSTAEQICDHLRKFLPHCSHAWTGGAHLPGGHFPNEDLGLFQKHIMDVYSNLPPPLLQHYLHNYGTRVSNLLIDVHNISNLGQHFGGLLYQREVDFLRHEEWAETAEDILWRRGKQGLLLTPEQAHNLENYLGR